MADAGRVPANGQRPQLTEQDIESKNNENYQQQLRLMDLQAKVNKQNQLVQAMSTIIKGNDEVLRHIGGSLK